MFKTLGWSYTRLRNSIHSFSVIWSIIGYSLPTFIIMFIIMNIYTIFVYYNEHYEYQKDHFAPQNRQIIG